MSWLFGGGSGKENAGGVTEKVIFENCTIEDAIEIISDFESYVDFIEGNDKAEITKRHDDGKTVDCYWKATIASIKTFEYTLRLTTNETSVEWTETDHGPFKKNRGGWYLKDLGDGRVEATYKVEIELNLWTPAFIKDWLIGKGLPKTLKAFKERIEAHAAKKSKN
jgi:ribosome-associated toxin RatA of RatAB toxin-antitoxin module